MKAKIKWYQEVLELEPSSKVFFPLAKLFANNDQFAEAVATLKQGLERHPEHFEARMLLIDCLGRLGAGDKLSAEISIVGDVLQKYPAFWKNWASSYASKPEGKDAALALSFLSAAFGETSISWSAVIEHGLRNVLAGTSTSVPAQPPFPRLVTTPKPVTLPADSVELDEDESDVMQDVPLPDAGLEEESSSIPLLKSHAQFSESEAAVYAGLDSVSDDDTDDDEPFSLRTLSMAKVLAEQGDVKGAIEICDELSASVESDIELKRIEALRESIVTAAKPGASDTISSKDEPQPLQGKTKLISTLESLAERLEARAAR